MSPKEKTSEAPFEESLARLEAIVEEMESGKLSLDQMMAHFEEGAALVKVCGGKLTEVEKKIELLIQKGNQLETAPFDADS
jgi:exodeoxyribonuclease VII small subunit